MRKLLFRRAVRHPAPNRGTFVTLERLDERCTPAILAPAPSTPQSFTGLNNNGCVATGFFNADSNLDIAITSAGSNTLSILNGQGNGKFTLAANLNVDPTGTQNLSVGFVAVGDLNGDGFSDIVTSEREDSGATASYFTVFINSGLGTFSRTQVPTGGRGASWIGIADFNSDGAPDLAVAHYGDQTPTGNGVTFFQNGLGSGKGSGVFTKTVSYSSGSDFIPNAAVIADFTGDGKPDVAFAVPAIAANPPTNGYVTVLRNNGTGSFVFANDIFDSGGPYPVGMAVGDLNRDGKQDLVVANAGDVQSIFTFGDGTAVTVLYGDGNAMFAPGPSYDAGTAGLNSAFSVAVSDLNLDGNPDIIAANYGDVFGFPAGSVITYISDGAGTFFNEPQYSDSESGNQFVAVGDFDGKGTPDVVAVGAHNHVTTLLNNTRPSATTLIASSTNAPSGTNITFTATSAITGGYADIPTGNVDFYDGASKIGSGTLALDTGAMKASFSTTALGVGGHNITAKYTGSFTVEPFTGASTSAATVVTITGAGNTPPTISAVADQKIATFSNTGDISFTVGDAESTITLVTSVGKSGNTAVIPDANISVIGTGTNRTVSVQSGEASGSALITLTVTDTGGMTATSQFTVTVSAAPNTPPTLGPIADKSVTAGGSTGNLSFTVGDAESTITLIGTVGTSGNTSVIPDANISVTGTGTTRTVNVQSTAAIGAAVITITATDPGGLTAISKFTVTVLAPNAPPTITAIANQSVIAGTTTTAAAFTVGDAETAVADLIVVPSSNNPALIPASAVHIVGTGASRTVSVDTIPGFSGDTTITLTITDGGGLPASTSFHVIQTANTSPSITPIANQTVNAGGTIGPINFLIGDNETDATLLTLDSATNNPALIPKSAIVFGGTAGMRTVTINTISGFSGTTTLTIIVADLNGGTASTQFTVTQNTPPTITPIANQFVTAGQTLGPIGFTVGDIETPGSLTVSKASSNGAVIPTANISIVGTGTSRTVSILAPTGVTGTSTITLTVSDPDGASSTTMFDVTVNAPVNTAPTITDITNKSINAGTSTGAIAFTIGDAETAANVLTVSAKTSDGTVIPQGNIVVSPGSESRTITITAPAGVSGTSTITVTVSDGSLSTSDTFDVQVTLPPNTSPTISNILDRTTPQGTATGSIAFTVGDAETALGSLTLSVVSSNTTLVPNANVVFGGTGGSKTLTVTPAAGQFGTSTITVTVTDGGQLTASDSFVLTVLPTPAGRAREFAIASDIGLVSTVRFFNPDHTERFTLQPFGNAFTGGIRTASADFNGDDVADLVVASGPGMAGTVRVLDGIFGTPLFETQPFGEAFVRGLVVSAGDMNKDGKAELVITAESGGGARVRIFTPGAGIIFSQMADFFALIGGDGIADTKFRGGGRSAVGDFNGDGFGDFAFAAGTGGGPRIAIFDGFTLQSTGNTLKIRGDFFAFEPNLRNGTYISAGDINGDGMAELVCGAGPGGGPRVSVFNGVDLMAGKEVRLKDFFAGDVTNRGGIRVAVKNIDADNQADLLVGAGPGGGSRATAYLGAALMASLTPPPAPTFEFDAFPGFGGGVYVG